jgi:hypothetical protein
MASLAGTLGATGAYLATAIIALAASLLAGFVAVRWRRGPSAEVAAGDKMMRFWGMYRRLSTICCG